MARSSRGPGAALLVLAVGCATLAHKPLSQPAGEPAPAAEGAASDGRLVRLSDQRGRVVLLSFWHGG
jgi:hypothetical protein